MTRIRGVGGTGKSSILNGIYFALYGKYRKPFTHGCKTCSVSLKYHRYKLEITRSKLPSNRLLVVYKGKEYEDDNAQSIINSVLGMDHNEFYASSYFDQKKHGSVLSMSPADQLSFIEAIAFGSDNSHEETRSKAKENVKALHFIRDGIASQLSLLNSQIEACEKKISKLQTLRSLETTEIENEGKIENTENIEDIKTIVSDLTTKIKELQTLLKSKRIELKSIQSLETNNRKAEDDRLKIETQIDSLNTLIEKLGEIKTEDEINEMKKKLTDTKQLVNDICEYLDVTDMQHRFDEEMKEYTAGLEKKKEDAKNSMMENADKKMVALASYEKLKPTLDEEELLLKTYNLAINTAKEGIMHIRDIIVTDHDVDDTINSIDKVGGNKMWSVLQKSIDTLISDYRLELNNAKDILSNIQYESWYCPKCNTALHPSPQEGEENESKESVLRIRTVKKGKNTYTKDDIPDVTMQLASAKSNISTLESYIENGLMYNRELNKPPPKKTKNNTGINSLQEYQELTIKLENHKKNKKLFEELCALIKSKETPSHLKKLKDQIKNKKQGLPKNLDKNLNKDVDKLSTYESEVISLEKYIEKAWNSKGDHSKHTRELKVLEKNLKSVNTRILKPKSSGISNTTDAKTLSEEIAALEKNIDELNENLTDANIKLVSLDDLSAVRHTTEELQNLLKTKGELEIKLKDANDDIEGAEGLEKTAIEAQFLSLEKTIGSINEHAKVYLANLFTLPIVAKFRIKTTTKKGNVSVHPGIEIYVEYKGDVYDDIDEFSGSERQRCDLAFLFAVNDMLGSNIIMLDECFNNMDDEMQSSSLEYIREMISTSSESSVTSRSSNSELIEGNADEKNKKQVLIITHRVSDGQFDHIVDPCKNECAIKTALGM
jgi:DNA repair exonuclease SbcCD ATPase subunit